MKNLFGKRCAARKKYVAVALITGICVSSIAEAGEVLNIDSDNNGTIYGNMSKSSEFRLPSDNTINMLSGSGARSVYAGYKWRDLGYNSDVEVNNNMLKIKNANIIDSAAAAMIARGYGAASGNIIIVDDMVSNGADIYAVQIEGGGGNVSKNTIMVNNSTAHNITAVNVNLEGQGNGKSFVNIDGNNVDVCNSNSRFGIYGGNIESANGVFIGGPEASYPVENVSVKNSNNNIVVSGKSYTDKIISSRINILRQSDWSNITDTNLVNFESNYNSVKIKDTTAAKNISASDIYVPMGNVLSIKNDVTIEDNSVIEYSAISAKALTFEGSVQLDQNRVDVLGGKIDGGIVAASASGGGKNPGIYNIVTSHNIVSVKPINDVVIGGIEAGTSLGTIANDININILSESNNVEFTGGHVKSGEITGGYASAYSQYDKTISSSKINVSATNNTVAISGGTIDGSVTGGKVTERVVGIDNDISAKATNNIVIISGGKIAGSVYGGNIQSNNHSNAKYEVKDNIVSWSGGTIGKMIFGDYNYSEDDKVHKGNSSINWDYNNTESTFNFYASSKHANKSIAGISNFKNYNFYIDDTVTPNATLIKVSSAVDLSKSNIGVARTSTSPLKKGDRITLLATPQLFTAENLVNDPSHMEGYAGNARSGNIYDVYDFDLINENGKNLVASLGKITPNEHPKIIAESRQPEIAFLDDKLDIVDYAYWATIDKNEPAIFIDFNYMDVKKGEWNLRGSDMVVGQAYTKKSEDTKNSITQGPFFEYGDNSYSGKNFYSSGDVDGSGKVKKYGAGYLFRQVKSGRHHLDAYIRAGKVTNDFNSYMAGLGNVDYDNSDVYYAAHLGYGQFLNIDPHTKMDVYGKYFFKTIPGSNTTTHVYGMGDIDTEFDALTSHKFRVGSKITWDYMKEKKKMMFADLALEHELSHTQTTNLGGRSLSNSSGADTTAVLELGYRQVFGPKDAFMFTMDLQGYVGTRKGLGGNIGVRFNF